MPLRHDIVDHHFFFLHSLAKKCHFEAPSGGIRILDLFFPFVKFPEGLIFFAPPCEMPGHFSIFILTPFMGLNAYGLTFCVYFLFFFPTSTLLPFKGYF